jgi:hypothetical protein
MPDFKPQMMPLMYWALAYGAAAGVILFILFLLSSFITVVWFPVFLVGLAWGGYRNYQQQKKRWYAEAGVVPPQQSPLAEFRQAAADIASSSQELLNQNAAEEEALENPTPLESVSESPEAPDTDQDSTEVPPGR